MSAFIEAIIQNIRAERVTLEAKSIRSKQNTLNRLESQKKKLVERVSSTTNTTLVAEYESSLKKIIEELPVRLFTDTSFGTTPLALLSKPLMMKETEKSNLVEMSGIEPESN